MKLMILDIKERYGLPAYDGENSRLIEDEHFALKFDDQLLLK